MDFVSCRSLYRTRVQMTYLSSLTLPLDCEWSGSADMLAGVCVCGVGRLSVGLRSERQLLEICLNCRFDLSVRSWVLSLQERTPLETIFPREM